MPLSRLIQGIVDFRDKSLPELAARFRDLAAGQAPDTLFVTCADSRVEPNLLVSTDPGELFTLRNVGNLVPPAAADGISVGDVSEASAIEYAVIVLRVSNIVVCGHSGCGAMKAVWSGGAIDDAPNLGRWLVHAQAAKLQMKLEDRDSGSLPPFDRLSQLNVLCQLDHLRTYPSVRAAVQAGRLHLIGWWFDIATGDMYGYEPERQWFALIDRTSAASFLRQV